MRWTFLSWMCKTVLPAYNSAKNYKNRSRCSRVMITNVLPPFYGSQCIYCLCRFHLWMSWHQVEIALTAHVQGRTSVRVASASVPGETIVCSGCSWRRGIFLEALLLHCSLTVLAAWSNSVFLLVTRKSPRPLLVEVVPRG